MTIDDKKLREFFEQERSRDGRAVPPFRELISDMPARAIGEDAPASSAGSVGPAREAGSKAGPVLRWWLSSGAVVTAAWAAVWLGLLLLQGRPGSSQAPTAITVETTELDAVCDAALAALDDLESEARMQTSTDVLLPAYDLDSD